MVNEFDVQKNEMTPRQIADLADDLNVEITDLMDKQSENFRKEYSNLSKDDLLQTIHKNMSLLKTPIIRKDETTGFFNSPYKAYPEDLEMKN